MNSNALLRHWPKVWLWGWFTACVAASISGMDLPHDLSHALETPSWDRLGGSDAFGRDLLNLLWRASARSSLFATLAVITTISLGVVLGGLMGLLPKWAEKLSARTLELVLAFPSLLLALAWAAARGPSWETLIVSLLIGSAPGFIRLSYVRSKEVLAEDYVLAAHAIGGAPSRIARHHLFPALDELARVKAPDLFAGALMSEATLSFLGVGAPIGADTWGSLLSQGREYLLEAPHIAFTTGLPLFITALALLRLSEKTQNRL